MPLGRVRQPTKGGQGSRELGAEDIAIAVVLGDDAVLAQIATAQELLEADATLQELRRKWLGNPYRGQSAATH